MFKADGLWVIIMHVGLWDKFLISFRIFISVSGSRDEVASSSIKMGFFLNKDLAIAIRWDCPSESPITVWIPFGRSFIKSKQHDFFRESNISLWEAFVLPYFKLSSIVPEKSVFPWGT